MGIAAQRVRVAPRMHSRLVTLGLLYLVTCLPAPASSRLIGTVQRLAGGKLHIGSAATAVTLHVDAETEIHKDGARSLASLRIGEEVSVTYRKDESNRLIATAIWANVVAFRATIHSVAPDCFDILTDHDPNPESANRKGYSRVFVYPETKFSTSEKDLAAGHEVHVVGLDVGGGNIDALRVTIYNTDLPVAAQQ